MELPTRQYFIDNRSYSSPVFESMTHLERLYKQLQIAKKENNSDVNREI
jgi:hypothetical protein